MLSKKQALPVSHRAQTWAPLTVHPQPLIGLRYPFERSASADRPCFYDVRGGMNKDQITGTIKETVGKVQQKTGELIDSPEQQAKGLAKQAEGLAQQKVGDVKEAAKDAADAVKKRI